MTTKMLADFAANIIYDDLSDKTVRMAKQCMLDWLGIALRGSQEKSSSIIRNMLVEQGGHEQATIFDGSNRKTSVANAAFCNGSASHSLDFDDLHNPSIIHPACVVLPPVFAIAETEHKSGKDMLCATVAGYEISGRAGESVMPESYFFWHTTGTAGTFGAGASAARILGLDADATLQCLGSAGTQVSGLWEFLKEGAMSKVLHAGKSAYAGVQAAYLARAGFTGATKILEGEKGFCRAMLAKPHWSKLTEGLGEGYKIDNNSFKPYACCKHAHAALYAMQVLRQKYNICAQDITGIDIHVNHITNFLINNAQPHNPYGCKFSIQYCVAGMLKWGEMGIEHFRANTIDDPEVRDTMSKIKVIEDPAIEAIHATDTSKLASKVVIHRRDRQDLQLQVDYPKGDPTNPMTWEDTVDKFNSLALGVCNEATTSELIALIDNLEKIPDFQVALAKVIK